MGWRRLALAVTNPLGSKSGHVVRFLDGECAVLTRKRSNDSVLWDRWHPMTRTARGMQEVAHAGISAGRHQKYWGNGAQSGPLNPLPRCMPKLQNRHAALPSKRANDTHGDDSPVNMVHTDDDCRLGMPGPPERVLLHGRRQPPCGLE
jgi:hypothetical protein